jgi:hypothetical protein
MSLDDAIADRQAETRALRARVQPGERREDALQVFLPDLRARIAHAEDPALRRMLRGECERKCVEGRVPECVVDQIPIQELHEVLVDAQARERRDLHANGAVGSAAVFEGETRPVHATSSRRACRPIFVAQCR